MVPLEEYLIHTAKWKYQKINNTNKDSLNTLPTNCNPSQASKEIIKHLNAWVGIGVKLCRPFLCSWNKSTMLFFLYDYWIPICDVDYPLCILWINIYNKGKQHENMEGLCSEKGFCRLTDMEFHHCNVTCKKIFNIGIVLSNFSLPFRSLINCSACFTEMEISCLCLQMMLQGAPEWAMMKKGQLKNTI